MSDPYPKTKQLARGERRYRRKVASPKQWQAIAEAKGTICRLAAPKLCEPGVELHHLVARSRGGDDVADNIVPLCRVHHGLVTGRHPAVIERLDRSLTEGETAYVLAKLGENGVERL
jgi:5-methylcytosine-specific restriction endonuclease McrA